MNSKINYDLANGKHSGGSNGGGSGGRSVFWSVLVIIILAAITEGWGGVLATVIVLGGIIGILLLIVYFKLKTEKGSYKSLNMLANGLNKSIDNSDYETCQKYCYSVLEWGGVLPKNDKRIMLLGNDICSYLKEVRNRFNSDIPYNQ